MAGVIVHVNSGEVTLAANTPKTVLQIKAPANQRLVIRTLRLLGKQAAGGTDPMVKVRLTRSIANFGTGTAAAPGKNDPSDSETLQATAAANFSIEPTSPADGALMWEIQPQAGVIESLGPGQEIKVPGGQAVNFEATTPSGSPTVMFQVSYEE